MERDSKTPNLKILLKMDKNISKNNVMAERVSAELMSSVISEIQVMPFF